MADKKRRNAMSTRMMVGMIFMIVFLVTGIIFSNTYFNEKKDVELIKENVRVMATYTRVSARGTNPTKTFIRVYTYVDSSGKQYEEGKAGKVFKNYDDAYASLGEQIEIYIGKDGRTRPVESGEANTLPAMLVMVFSWVLFAGFGLLAFFPSSETREKWKENRKKKMT